MENRNVLVSDMALYINKTIKSNLLDLFNFHFEAIKNASIEKMFDQMITENPDAFSIELGIITKLYNKDAIRSFNKAKKNVELIATFDSAKKMEFDEKQIVGELKADILHSISEIKSKINVEKKRCKNQIIFLEYDYEPWAYFCGYGEGEYPVLERPAYFTSSYGEVLYFGVGKVDYSKIWIGLTTLDDSLENMNIYDHVVDMELYQTLLNAVKFKTYLLLHEAFDQLGIKAFDGIEIKKPLVIYGNERECEPVNIYAFK